MAWTIIDAENVSTSHRAELVASAAEDTKRCDSQIAFPAVQGGRYDHPRTVAVTDDVRQRIRKLAVDTAMAADLPDDWSLQYFEDILLIKIHR